MEEESVSSVTDTEMDYSSWKFKSYGHLAVFLPDELITQNKDDKASVVPRADSVRTKLEKLVDITVFTEDELMERNSSQPVAQKKSLPSNNNNNNNKAEPNRTICSECGKMVKVRSYEMHMRKHQYKCNLCRETFGTSRMLEAHMDLHQNNTYPCETCQISFKDAFEFACHDQKHSAFGIFKCPICPFETMKKISLRQHIKVHNNDFKCICEICGRGFLSFAAHADHMKLHEGEKQFECEYCNRNFNLKRYLDMHQKLNHKDILFGQEEWYTCHVCGRNFKFETSLARHLSCIHDIGESRRVSCPICAKVIANNYNLKVHMRMHNGERPYVCHVCKMGFARFKYLKKHMLRKHKN